MVFRCLILDQYFLTRWRSKCYHNILRLLKSHFILFHQLFFQIAALGLSMMEIDLKVLELSEPSRRLTQWRCIPDSICPLQNYLWIPSPIEQIPAVYSKNTHRDFPHESYAIYFPNSPWNLHWRNSTLWAILNSVI